MFHDGFAKSNVFFFFLGGGVKQGIETYSLKFLLRWYFCPKYNGTDRY